MRYRLSGPFAGPSTFEAFIRHFFSELPNVSLSLSRCDFPSLPPDLGFIRALCTPMEARDSAPLAGAEIHGFQTAAGTDFDRVLCPEFGFLGFFWSVLD